MVTAVSVTVAAVAKKLLALLLGDKKGRKFLLYTVCIALFVLCLPMIVLLGLFGWMAGDSATILDQSNILANIPNDQLVQIQTIEKVSDNIDRLFEDLGLEDADTNKATAIYMGYLTGFETSSTFYNDLANCFLTTADDADIYDRISQTFLVVISDEDKSKFDSLYGITPIRLREEF